jgi:hypothetical protein
VELNSRVKLLYDVNCIARRLKMFMNYDGLHTYGIDLGLFAPTPVAIEFGAGGQHSG